MTLDQIVNYVNYICVKENSGSTFTPDQINLVFPVANVNMFNRRVQEAQVLGLQYKIPFSQALYEHAALREFHIPESITFTTGSFDLTTLTNTYAYWLSLIAHYNGEDRQIELLPDKIFADRRTNIITSRKIKKYPIAMTEGNNIKVLPNDITTAEFTFMKKPATPVYDYYYDANANLIYLAVGASHTLTGGEVGSAGQTSGTVTSNTVELEWNSLFHVEFCNEVLAKVGIALKDEQLRTYAKEVEEKQP